MTAPLASIVRRARSGGLTMADLAEAIRSMRLWLAAQRGAEPYPHLPDDAIDEVIDDMVSSGAPPPRSSPSEDPQEGQAA